MSGFHFRLERVLHWRALELASEEARLKRLLEEQARLKAHLDSVRNAISELPAHVAAFDEIRGTDLNHMAAYRMQLTAKRDRLVGQCREQLSTVAGQVEIHRKAKQRHQLLVELRNRRHGEWNMGMLRQLDELAHESYLARWGTT